MPAMNRHGAMRMVAAMARHDIPPGDALSHGSLLDFRHAMAGWRRHGRFLITLNKSTFLYATHEQKDPEKILLPNEKDITMAIKNVLSLYSIQGISYLLS